MTTIDRRVIMSNPPVRYYLTNGWFIDREKYPGSAYKYTAWAPGASPCGCAAQVGGGNTLLAALTSIGAK